MTNTFKPDCEWWTQQWLDLLNSYRFKKRLERARNYARQGNVLRIDFEGQKVIAQVQGTEPAPYQVSLWLDPFTDEDWEYVLTTLSERAYFSAKLLAGEMPQNIEEVFAANGLRLFPFSLEEVHSRCSCPDKANPCKHIGAVYYMLGDRFSDDPFVLFQLRGRTQAQVLATLRGRRLQESPEVPAPLTPDNAGTPDITPPNLPLLATPSGDLEDFWHYQHPLESSLVVITPPPSSETVLDILGAIPFSVETPGKVSPATQATSVVMDYLGRVYQTVSQKAVLTALNLGNNPEN